MSSFWENTENILSSHNCRYPRSRSWITAIVGAEYIFSILPKGTHEFEKFIKPSELSEYMENTSVKLIEAKGMFYNPITHHVTRVT